MTGTTTSRWAQGSSARGRAHGEDAATLGKLEVASCRAAPPDHALRHDRPHRRRSGPSSTRSHQVRERCARGPDLHRAREAPFRAPVSRRKSTSTPLTLPDTCGTLTHDELGRRRRRRATRAEARPKIERERCEARERDRSAKGHEQAESTYRTGRGSRPSPRPATVASTMASQRRRRSSQSPQSRDSWSQD